MKETLISALKGGSIILMEHFGNLVTYNVKENQSNIVTLADLESEKEIVKTIESQFSEHNILAEETGYKNKNSNYTWVIDPLDGTANFSVGLPSFGVLICVMENNLPVIGGAYLPYYDLMYLAEKGKGATKNGKAISVSHENQLKNVLVSYSLDYSEDFLKTKNEVAIIEKLVQNVRNLRADNCLVDYCNTADGRLGASLNQTTKIWDIAAPALIVEEAGGIVTDINGQRICLDIDKNNYINNYTIVCSTPELHPQIMKLIQSVN